MGVEAGARTSQVDVIGTTESRGKLLADVLAKVTGKGLSIKEFEEKRKLFVGGQYTLEKFIRDNCDHGVFGLKNGKIVYAQEVEDAQNRLEELRKKAEKRSQDAIRVLKLPPAHTGSPHT